MLTISIPVVRGGVQPCRWLHAVCCLWISIPVVRGGVQLVDGYTQCACGDIFQFPWCVGEFNNVVIK